MNSSLIVEQPIGYAEWLGSLKERIRAAQQKAVLAANREMIYLYWQIGREILERQERQGWGAKVVERLAQDLQREFPEIKGYSYRNLLFIEFLPKHTPTNQF